MHYSKDVYYAFYEITDISSYIFNYLKSVIDKDIRNGTHIDVDEVISLSQFMKLILEDFQETIIYKDKLINQKLTPKEFDEKYASFKHEFIKKA